MNRIIGIPESEYEYEFMVVSPEGDGDYRWMSNHETPDAYEVAQRTGCLVVHNLRIAGRERKKTVSGEKDCAEPAAGTDAPAAG